MKGYFYITTPIYYVNAKPHLGHVYTTVIADVLARYHKLVGDTVFFLTGTDEHGDKIAETARKLGTTPRELADENSARFRELWPEISVENDRFIRTTEPITSATVQMILKTVYDRGEHLLRRVRRALLRGLRAVLHRDRDGRRQVSHPRHRARVPQRAELLLPDGEKRSWLIEHITSNPGFIGPSGTATRSWACFASPWTTCASPGPSPGSPGASSCPSTATTCATCGSTPSSTISRAWDIPTHRTSRTSGGSPSTWWARTSSSPRGLLAHHAQVHGCRALPAKPQRARVLERRPGQDVQEPGQRGRTRWTSRAKYGIDAFRYFLVREMVFGLDSNFSEEALIERYNGGPCQ